MSTKTDELMRLHDESVCAWMATQFHGTAQDAKEADDALRSAIQEVVMGVWQNIDGAPLDGATVYLHEAGRVFRGSWCEIPFKEYRDTDGFYVGQQDAEAYWMDNETGEECSPSHWQPLPPLPEPPEAAS